MLALGVVAELQVAAPERCRARDVQRRSRRIARGHATDDVVVRLLKLADAAIREQDDAVRRRLTTEIGDTRCCDLCPGASQEPGSESRKGSGLVG